MLFLAELQNSTLQCDVVAIQAMLNVCRDAGQGRSAVEALAELRELVWGLIPA